LLLSSGQIKKADKILAFATGAKAEALEVGYFSPKLISSESLSEGEIGYIATGLKDASQIRVGDTITSQFTIHDSQFKPLPGYKEPKPMVFGSFFPD
jgi:GTP-binding protein LepA